MNSGGGYFAEMIDRSIFLLEQISKIYSYEYRNPDD